MKKALICVLATILVVAVGFYVVVVRPLVSPAAQTFAAEAALATPDLILLAAVNVRQAVFLERWYLGAPAVATGTSRAVRPPAERTILEHLAAARVDMRRDVEHVLYGLYPATEQGVRHASSSWASSTPRASSSTSRATSVGPPAPTVAGPPPKCGAAT